MIAENSEEDEGDEDPYKIDPRVKETSKIGKEMNDIALDIKKFRGLLNQQQIGSSGVNL